MCGRSIIRNISLTVLLSKLLGFFKRNVALSVQITLVTDQENHLQINRTSTRDSIQSVINTRSTDQHLVDMWLHSNAKQPSLVIN